MSALPQHETWTIGDLPEDTSYRYEIYDGSLHVTPQPTNRHTLMAALLAEHLSPVASQHGMVVGSGWGVSPTPDNYLVPDLVLVDRAAVARSAEDHALHPQWVTLVVEVLSPSTQRLDLTLKADVYRAWGIPHYWVLDQVTAAHRGHEPAAVQVWVWQAYEAFLRQWRAL